ncbi:Os10g0163250, partial [Oryza sativa Japonica Group]
NLICSSPIPNPSLPLNHLHRAPFLLRSSPFCRRHRVPFLLRSSLTRHRVPFPPPLRSHPPPPPRAFPPALRSHPPPPRAVAVDTQRPRRRWRSGEWIHRQLGIWRLLPSLCTLSLYQIWLEGSGRHGGGDDAVEEEDEGEARWRKGWGVRISDGGT